MLSLAWLHTNWKVYNSLYSFVDFILKKKEQEITDLVSNHTIMSLYHPRQQKDKTELQSRLKITSVAFHFQLKFIYLSINAVMNLNI